MTSKIKSQVNLVLKDNKKDNKSRAKSIKLKKSTQIKRNKFKVLKLELFKKSNLKLKKILINLQDLMLLYKNFNRLKKRHFKYKMILKIIFFLNLIFKNNL